jgi:hypothetical protein
MPRYFFDILHGGEDVTRDHSGIDLPNLEAAKIEALEIWKRLIRERTAGASDPFHWHVAVLDENGMVLAKIPCPSELAREHDAEPKRSALYSYA